MKNSQGEHLTLVLAVVGGVGESIDAWFDSKDNTLFNYNPPRLVIKYEAIPEPEAPEDTNILTFNPIADTYVDSSDPESNYGNDYFINIDFFNRSDSEDIMRNTYLLFDLTTLDPELFAIESATLELYSGFNPSIAAVGVYSCSDTQWSELEITWSNAPAFSPEPLDIEIVALYHTWYSWNVTEEVKNSQEGYLTLVLTVENDGESLSTNFNSKDSYSDNHPRLVITYEANGTLIFNPVADTYVSSSNAESNYGNNNHLTVTLLNISSLNRRDNAYLMFDLSTLSIDTQSINSAILELYCYGVSSTATQVGVYSCSDTQWSELEITWSNAPAFSPEPLDVIPVAFDDTWYSWNVTEEVKNSQGELLTLVLAVEGGEGGYVTTFDSKEWFLDNPARLVIEYGDIPEPEPTPQTSEPPVASFTYFPLHLQVNDTITFDASGSSDTDGTIVSYLWNFGDGDTSTSQNPTHAYDQEGAYTITLTVTDNDGLTDNTTVSIAEVVIPEFSSWMILPIFLTATLFAIVFKKRVLQSRSQES